MGESYANYIKKFFNFSHKVLLDDYKQRQDKEYFRPSGVNIYVGWQGSGKTLSAVFHAHNLSIRYPKMKIVTNLNLDESYFKCKVIKFSSFEDLHKLLVNVNNDKFGVLYLIDEIHTYFNALESKNIPISIFAEIAQQRKQKKVVIGTSQLWDRVAKPFREQASLEIKCKTYFNFFTFNKVIDAHTLKMDKNSGMSVGDVIKRGWFFHTRELRNSYDTFQKVISGKDFYEMEYENQMQFENHGRGRSRRGSR